jgi:hypothetical protein
LVTIALHEDHGRKADVMRVRALWSPAAPVVLLIVDLIATSQSGDVAQNSEPNIAFTTPQHASVRG